MPPYRVFMCNCGLTPTEWLQANYPEHYPSQKEMIDQYTKAFIEDYLRLKVPMISTNAAATNPVAGDVSHDTTILAHGQISSSI